MSTVALVVAHMWWISPRGVDRRHCGLHGSLVCEPQRRPSAALPLECRRERYKPHCVYSASRYPNGCARESLCEWGGPGLLVVRVPPKQVSCHVREDTPDIGLGFPAASRREGTRAGAGATWGGVGNMRPRDKSQVYSLRPAHMPPPHLSQESRLFRLSASACACPRRFTLEWAPEQAAAGVLAGAGKPDEQLERECRAAILEAQSECGVGSRPLSAKLTQIVRQKGWPARYRPLFWSWAGTARRKAEEAEGRTYARLVAHRRPKDACSSLAEIERDLGRTLPGQRGPDGDEDYFAAGPGRDRLRNVLAAYAAFNPTVGYTLPPAAPPPPLPCALSAQRRLRRPGRYCQSMNFVAAVLLLQLRDEESAFWVLVALVEDVLVGYYHRSLAGLRVDQAVLEGAVEEQLPALAAHLRDVLCPHHRCVRLALL